MKFLFKMLLVLVFSFFLISLDSVDIIFAQDSLNCQQTESHDQLAQPPGSAVFLCQPGFASEKDILMVYASGGSPGVESFAHLEIYESAVYIFDAYADGAANLILFFLRTPHRFVARMYDDQDGDGEVSYLIEDGEIIIDESQYWTIQVASPHNWVTASGMVSYNLDLQVDGGVDAIWSSTKYLEGLGTDGTVDFTIRVRDTDLNGSPDYEIRQAYPPQEYWHLAHTWLGVAEKPLAPPTRGAVIWPYLGSGHFDFFQRFNNYYAPLQVNWYRSKITTLVEFIPSHEGDDVWYIQSFEPFGERGQTYANFENPVCWIDLAEDSDGFPELHIRQEYYGVQDRRRWFDLPASSKNDIRYTWDQDNDASWDYKLGLSGGYPIDQVVSFPGFTVETIPCSQFPGWIISKSWGPAVFVAAYRRNYGEGIYEWGTVGRDLERFMFGYGRQPDKFTDLPVGFRGEYSYHLNDRPWLYLHPLDRMIHLKGSTAGFYQISENRVVSFSDRNSDSYIDQWRTVESGVLLDELFLGLDYLIYHDHSNGEVSIKKLLEEFDYSEFLPPDSNSAWASLSEQIGTNYETGALEIGKLFHQLSGETIDLVDAHLYSLRETGRGIRFELILSPGFSVLGEDLVGINNLEPGKYTLIYRDGFTLAPFTPAAIRMLPGSLLFDPSRVSALQPVRLTAALENTGLESLTALPVQLYAEVDGERSFVAERRLDLGGESQAQLSFTWTPTGPGDWTLHLLWGSGEGGPASYTHGEQSLSVGVSQPERYGPLGILALSSPRWPLAALLLVLAAAGSLGLGILVLRKGGSSS